MQVAKIQREVVSQLSPALQKEVIFKVHGHWLKHVRTGQVLA